MKYILSIAVVGLLFLCLGQRAEANGYYSDYYHLFRDGCVVSSYALGPTIEYTGPPPAAGYQDCVISSTELLFCVTFDAEYQRRVNGPYCESTTRYSYCPVLKGASWGLMCDRGDAVTKYSASVPHGFKYCIGSGNNQLYACADISTVASPKYGFREVEEGTDGVAKFLEMPDDQVEKTEEKAAFPSIGSGASLMHCAFRDAIMIGCRNIKDDQYKTKTPYLDFTGAIFREGSISQGYIASTPTITGIQYAIASFFRFFTDNFFLTTLV